MRKATLHDVAHATGVSTRTVSRVVNNEEGFSDETRERVLAAIKELGYRPNMAARSLITNKTQTIGLVVYYLTDPFFPGLADGVERAARQRKHTIYLSTHDGVPGTQREVLDSLASHGVDASIVFPCVGGDGDLRELVDGGLPLVVIDKDIRHPGIGIVSSDIYGGAVMATEHLVAAGREQLAMLGNVTADTQRREGGFRQVMQTAGLEIDERRVIRAEPTIDGARAATRQILDEAPDLTGLFAYNDLMAIGAIDELKRAGRVVPDDVAVVGFDDIPLTAYMTPPITTVRLNREQVGAAAVEMAVRLAGDPRSEVDPVIVPVSLIERGSA